LRSHAHGVDHCGTSWSVHNNQLKKPSSFVRSQHEVPVRIFSDLLDHECVSKGVLNVLARDPVAESRWQFIHYINRTTKPAQANPLGASWPALGGTLNTMSFGVRGQVVVM